MNELEMYRDIIIAIQNSPNCKVSHLDKEILNIKVENDSIFIYDGVETFIYDAVQAANINIRNIVKLVRPINYINVEFVLCKG